MNSYNLYKHKQIEERAVEVANYIIENNAERHIRGGMATREKYLHLAQHSHRGDFF